MRGYIIYAVGAQINNEKNIYLFKYNSKAYFEDLNS